MLISLAMSLAGAGTAAPTAVPAVLDCSHVLQLRQPEPARRSIEAHDLIETLDIGSNGAMEEDPVFTLSPDQSRLAVGVRRAVTASNAYCSGVYVVSADGRPSLIDANPGAARFQYDNFFNTHGFRSGIAKVMRPLWSPYGSQLAYLKLVDDRLQLWLWDERHHSRAAVSAENDIVDFRFGADGKTMVYKLRERSQSEANLAREALQGYHFDDRFFPFASTTPFPRGAAAYSFHALDLSSGSTRPATEAEVAEFASEKPLPRRDDARIADVKAGADGISRVRVATGAQERICRSESCTDVSGQPWLTPSGHVRYLRREGWGRSITAIYDWKGGEDSPQRLFETSDILMGCGPLGENVVCAREASTRPRYIDKINVSKGTSSILFEPNPGFRSLILGRVNRLQWTNGMDVPSYGDLVYPPDFKEGRRYPLIVTQYGTRGFLRGGTGDEFPIQLFARAGYMVLSVERTQSPFPVKGLAPQDWQRRENQGFIARRSILSTIETKVEQLIQAGLIDPDRVGITGLSDGATTTQFAALHSKMFKAASISGCCWEPSQTWLLGSAIQQQYERDGWPASPDTGSGTWSQISLSRNAGRVAFPILIQAADAELIPGLEAVRALRAASSPVDVFVFPDEQHIKWQPAHRLNVYQRNLRWFDFWLKGIVPPDDGQRAEVVRWAEMKSLWEAGK